MYMSYQLAIQLFNEAYQLQSNGDFDRAEKCYSEGLKLDPSNYEALHFLGIIQCQKGNFNLAIENISKAITLCAENPSFYNNLGIAHHALKNYEKALFYYEKAATIQPDLSDAHFNQGNALLDLELFQEAFNSYCKAITINPENIGYWKNLALVLPYLEFSSYDDSIASIFVKLFKPSLGIDTKAISFCAIKLLKRHPVVEELMRNPDDNFMACATKLSRIPLLLSILEGGNLQDPEFEFFLTHLRKISLKNIDSIRGDYSVIPILVSLSLQCFNNEYIFFTTKDERETIRALENEILSKLPLNNFDPFVECLLLSLYCKLSNYDWVKSLDMQLMPSALIPLFRTQLYEVIAERELAKKINSITLIKDEVSLLVQSQYESNPYPRWTVAPICESPISLESFAKGLNPYLIFKDNFSCAPDVLIAGCGTGQHAISSFSRFENCKVLAIDLSLSSLAYAIRKTNELGMSNIEYAQADILQINKIRRSFDIIESCGVLHHMANPIEGWKALVDCLKPNGLMKIALYSEESRKSIATVRELLFKNGIGSDSDSIRMVRQKIIDGNEPDWASLSEITLSPDFYSMSNCRDLLFHVQEHRFTISEIQACLDDLGLEFICFEFPTIFWPNKFKNLYCDQDQYSLKAWEHFEMKYPNTFTGMYQFWVRKIAP